MNRWLLFPFACLALAWGFAPRSELDGLWLDDLGEAVQLARETDRPLLVVFR